MNRLVFLSTLILSAHSCQSRESALECFYKKADRNHDGFISVSELEHAINHYLPWYERYPFKMFGGIEKILKDCDANGDRLLSKDESILTEKTCLETCFKRSRTMSTFNCKIKSVSKK